MTGAPPFVARLAALVDGEGAAARIAEIEAAALALVRAGEGDAAIAPLQRLCAALPDVARAWWLLGVALHDAQRHEEALVAMTRATGIAPQDPRGLLGRAQLRYETGRPAADAFADLHRRLPGDAAIVRNWSGALAAEGRPDAAETVLTDALAVQPGWIDGQARLATLRQTMGQADYDRGYRSATMAEPRNLALRLAWFQLLAKARHWDAARAVLADAAGVCGDQPALVAARLFVAAEADADGGDRDPFAGVPDTADPGLAICRVRSALRRARPDEALRVAAGFDATPAAAFFWPYRSLAWRLLGDDRADWLDRPDRFVACHPLGLSAAELAELADVLRALHVMAAPYLDQSVRGGTQTDRPLLFNHEPIIRRTRIAILEAVRAHVDALPPREPGHPLLGAPRTSLRVAGSWSVRLRGQGFHASHTHPAGWLSSAFYVALPPDLGPAPAGRLQLGAPPPELGLPLGPTREIEPVAGTLALFPATTWHGTAPFADGERLTIAFDIAPPRR